MPVVDSALFIALNRGAANPFLDWLMPRITNLHQHAWFLVCAVVVFALLLWRGDRRIRVWTLSMLVAVSLSDLTAYRIVKYVWPRDRPCHQSVAGGPMSEPETRLVSGTHCPGSPSFPSSHASNMMALAVVCWWFTRKPSGIPGSELDSHYGLGRSGHTTLPFLWFLIPLIIGYSRMYLGFHYPSDVVGGWILGAFIAVAVVAVARRWLPTVRDDSGMEMAKTPSEYAG